MSGNGAKIITFVVVSVGAWYGGMKFWQPIIIEHLKETNNLRDDVYVAELEQPKSLEDLKLKVKQTLHPDKFPSPQSKVAVDDASSANK